MCDEAHSALRSQKTERVSTAAEGRSPSGGRRAGRGGGATVVIASIALARLFITFITLFWCSGLQILHSPCRRRRGFRGKRRDFRGGQRSQRRCRLPGLTVPPAATAQRARGGLELAACSSAASMVETVDDVAELGGRTSEETCEADCLPATPAAMRETASAPTSTATRTPPTPATPSPSRTLPTGGERVRVYARCRPLLQPAESAVACDGPQVTVEQAHRTSTFSCDAVFGPDASQAERASHSVPTGSPLV